MTIVISKVSYPHNGLYTANDEHDAASAENKAIFNCTKVVRTL